MLKFLLEKEFKQFIRNPFLPRLVLLIPVMMLLVLPWAADLNTKHVRLAVVDRDGSPYSQRLVRKATSSDYFLLYEQFGCYREALHAVEMGEADLILEIPRHFERDLIREKITDVLIAANTVNGTKGLLGSSYLARILADFTREISVEQGAGVQITTRTPQLEVIPEVRYNPQMDYKRFMVPAFMVILMTLICGFLPALNVVTEKEVGTIEQINVTPVGRTVFILAKLIPYWIMGFIVLTIGMLIAWLVYGITPAGSLLTIYAAFVVYVVALSGFGIVISNHSSTMQQAMFLTFFFMIIFVLLSGIFTPISSMPAWAQGITLFNPLRYFVTIIRSVFFKASSVADLGIDFLALGCFAIVSNVWAVVSYRKSS